MRTISNDTRLRASPDCVVRDLSGEIILLNLRNGTYYGLDQTGVIMWGLLSSAVDIDFLVRTLHQRSGEDILRIDGDVRAFVGDLLEHGLVDMLVTGES